MCIRANSDSLRRPEVRMTSAILAEDDANLNRKRLSVNYFRYQYVIQKDITYSTETAKLQPLFDHFAASKECVRECDVTVQVDVAKSNIRTMH